MRRALEIDDLTANTVSVECGVQCALGERELASGGTTTRNVNDDGAAPTSDSRCS